MKEGAKWELYIPCKFRQYCLEELHIFYTLDMIWTAIEIVLKIHSKLMEGVEHLLEFC